MVLWGASAWLVGSPPWGRLDPSLVQGRHVGVGKICLIVTVFTKLGGLERLASASNACVVLVLFDVEAALTSEDNDQQSR